MSKIHLQRPHVLGLDGARQAVQRVADEMTAKYGLQCEWAGDVLSFSRAGVSGTLAVAEAEILLEAELGVLLSAFRPRIEEQLQKNFDHYFS
ncbi:polyhydroxyalkanoic acid system family protein [Burkholderiaceae bacterium FT117]|uniref:polyhydroxyalkanoic acid system family protein n=1 Tax=Zeimonas sediminis TaxID=2944268 RepID=UPI002342BF2D|nr:polyhydroxyalkanoic acid system family protein [Zeimonas sediminis]MCM5572151.1 polyhydroxyalkanoic acid system family protein [Zeimonas sediminis]